MKASFSWLRELVPGLPDDRQGDRRRASRTRASRSKAMHEYGAGADACVVARVVAMRPHPTKSGLRLVTVDRGGGTQEVVCGAPNVPEPGGLVVLAPLGAHLPAKGMTIAPRDIGGVASEGMLCSESELGLSDDASRASSSFPPGTAEPGTPLADGVPGRARHDLRDRPHAEPARRARSRRPRARARGALRRSRSEAARARVVRRSATIARSSQDS